MPGTRTDVLCNIDTWLHDFDAHNILWLHGSPGSGKSAIASTVLSSTEQCRAWFFFRKDEADLKDPSRVWRRIARDLAEWNADVRKCIVQALEKRNASVKDMDIDTQFEHLIANPLTKTVGDGPAVPILVIFDALDECDSYDEFLRTLTRWSKLCKEYKLIVTSRDYPSIRLNLAPISQNIALLTGDEVTEKTSADLQRFMTSSFRRIAELHSGVLSPDWPGLSEIEKLVGHAAGLFIWAKAALDFVGRGDPVRRLSLISENDWEGIGSVDSLYRRILEVALGDLIRDERSAFHAVTASIVLAKDPLSCIDLQHLLGLSPTMLQTIVNGLSPVLSIGGEDRVLRVCHQSFSDFLLDSKRSEALAIDVTGQNLNLAKGCLEILNQKLRFNICHLETSHKLNSDILNREQRIKDMISTTVQHASRHWAEYLPISSNERCDAEILRALQNFLHIHFLHWLEVLSLIKAVDIAPGRLLNAAKWIGVSCIFDLNCQYLTHYRVGLQHETLIICCRCKQVLCDI
jgi:hypothetical protein